MLEYQLFFGRSAVTDQAWADFTKDVVTANLPGGFTAFDTDGQWMNPGTHRIIQERYPSHAWNIYGAQASDGDNYTGDTAECLRMLRSELMPLCQYFAYIEVREKQEAPILSGGIESGLWRGYEELTKERENFAMKRVFEQREIFPVFRELFAKTRT